MRRVIYPARGLRHDFERQSLSLIIARPASLGRCANLRVICDGDETCAPAHAARMSYALHIERHAASGAVHNSDSFKSHARNLVRVKIRDDINL